MTPTPTPPVAGDGRALQLVLDLSAAVYAVKETGDVDRVARAQTALVAALSAASAAEPQGWRLVPVEPTKAMIDSAFEMNDSSVRAIWAVMLRFAPRPPAPGASQVHLQGETEGGDHG